MTVKDIQNLLDKFFADSFTMDCLCKATNVSPDLINKAYAKENLELEFQANSLDKFANTSPKTSTPHAPYLHRRIYQLLTNS